MNCSVTDVEADVVDKLKYIEETKETMDKNAKKLAELAQDISGIHKGKKIFDYFTGANIILCLQFVEFSGLSCGLAPSLITGQAGHRLHSSSVIVLAMFKMYLFIDSRFTKLY